MSFALHTRKSLNKYLYASLVVLILLFAGIEGCAPVTAQPVETADPAPSPMPENDVSVTAESETFIGGEGACAYSISYPSDMESGTLGWQYSWILRYHDLVLPPPEVANNFIYISALPARTPTDGVGVVINYDYAEVETLEQMEIGESTTLRSGSDTAQETIFTRLPDKIIADQVAQAYESTEPSNSSTRIKEVRYYFRDSDCSYLIGAHLNAADSDQAGAITEELFDQIIATFDLIP